MNVRMASSAIACQIKFSTIADLTMNGTRPPSKILDSNPPSGIDSHGRPENDINNNVGPPIYCEGSDSPVQNEQRSPYPELEQTASPELGLRR
ncbi:hypothetical protein GJ496_003861 [Pomphorhynchus laevis]|nr:hypothetical protein GJ496_003861 [Pomphorhynchus laevis]